MLSTAEQISEALIGIADAIDGVVAQNLSDSEEMEVEKSLSGVVAMILRLLPLILEIIRGF